MLATWHGEETCVRTVLAWRLAARAAAAERPTPTSMPMSAIDFCAPRSSQNDHAFSETRLVHRQLRVACDARGGAKQHNAVIQICLRRSGFRAKSSHKGRLLVAGKNTRNCCESFESCLKRRQQLFLLRHCWAPLLRRRYQSNQFLSKTSKTVATHTKAAGNCSSSCCDSHKCCDLPLFFSSRVRKLPRFTMSLRAEVHKMLQFTLVWIARVPNCCDLQGVWGPGAQTAGFCAPAAHQLPNKLL